VRTALLGRREQAREALALARPVAQQRFVHLGEHLEPLSGLVVQQRRDLGEVDAHVPDYPQRRLEESGQTQRVAESPVGKRGEHRSEVAKAGQDEVAGRLGQRREIVTARRSGVRARCV